MPYLDDSLNLKKGNTLTQLSFKVVHNALSGTILNSDLRWYEANTMVKQLKELLDVLALDLGTWLKKRQHMFGNTACWFCPLLFLGSLVERQT